MKPVVTNKFDVLYAGFDVNRPFGIERDYYEWQREHLFDAVSKSLVPGSVLDNGGGFGYFARFVPTHHYVNCDVSENMLAADPGNHPKVRVDGKTLPFADSLFDNVVSLGVLRHVEDPEAYLSECRRVLRPGGVFVLATVRKGYERDLAFSWLFWVIALYYFQWVIPETIRQKIRKLIAGREVKTPAEAVPYISYVESDLEKRLAVLGFEVIRRGRFCKDLPGPIPWRLADKIVDEARFGKFAFFACCKR